MTRVVILPTVNMNLNEIEAQVIAIIAKRKKLDPSLVTLDSTFVELGIDSIDAIDLLFAFEDRFQIDIPNAAASEMKSVRQVAGGLRQLIKVTSASAS